MSYEVLYRLIHDQVQPIGPTGFVRVKTPVFKSTLYVVCKNVTDPKHLLMLVMKRTHYLPNSKCIFTLLNIPLKSQWWIFDFCVRWSTFTLHKGMCSYTTMTFLKVIPWNWSVGFELDEISLLRQVHWLIRHNDEYIIEADWNLSLCTSISFPKHPCMNVIKANGKKSSLFQYKDSVLSGIEIPMITIRRFTTVLFYDGNLHTWKTVLKRGAERLT